MKLPIALALSSLFGGVQSRISVPVTQKVLILDEEIQCNNTSVDRPDCETACLTPNNRIEGMALIACTDSDNVNRYTCSYESARRDNSADCNSCLTDDETGLFFERKTLKPKQGTTPCQTSCEYTLPEYGEEDICASVCPSRNFDNDLPLTHCTLKEDDENVLVCRYEGMSDGFCNSCPTDDEVGDGWFFWNKNTIEQGNYCTQTCRYDK